MKTMALSVLVICALAGGIQAETRTVPSDYPSIQSAIDASHDGDVVLVLPGVYFENINFRGKNITVTGSDPDSPGVVGYTVINADDKGSGVLFESGETPLAVLTGFTITKGTGTYSASMTAVTGARTVMGSGVCCFNSSPTITKNVIVRNIGPFNVTGPTAADVVITCGGGIGGYNASPVITYNTIRTNSAYAGGGIMSYFGQPVIGNNVIFENTSYVGGGVFTLAGSIYNNTIHKNDCTLSGGQGAGGNCYFVFDRTLGNTRVFNNIITSAVDCGGIYWEGDVSTGTFAYNDVWGNSPINYMVQDETGEAGNISADPKFRSALSRDYHLTLESPCVNAGDPDYVPPAGATDIDREARIYGARIDIGADEYVGYIKPVAEAGLDAHVLAPLTPVRLDGSGSFFYDPTGPTSYQWTQVSGPAGSFDDPNTAAPVFTPEAEGTYVLELVVADDRYSSAPDQLVVFVGPNQDPIADAGPNIACASPGYAELDGSRSHDPDPVDHLQYSWRQVEGPAVELQDAATVNPKFPAQPGEQYTFDLVVNDGFVDSAPSRVTITGVEASLAYQSFSAYTANFDLSNWPDVSGSRVVFAIGSSTIYQLRITWMDLLTEETGTFSNGMSMQPKIDGDLVVWSGGPGAASSNGLECTSVFLRNIISGAQTVLRTYSDTQSFSHPAVSGHTVVWVQHAGINRVVPAQWLNMPYDICGADVTDIQHPVYFTIAEKVGRRDPYPYQDPLLDVDRVVDISGNLVVWEGDGDIYAADISDINDIKVFPVCQAPGRQFSPAVSGKYVVWTDQRNDSGDIYGADISDPQNVRVFEVAGGQGIQQQPAIDGCLVTYIEGKTSGQVKVACITARYGDLDSGLPSFLAGFSPAIDGETVIWVTSSYGYGQGIRLGFGYSAFDGLIQNRTTGRLYDYVQHAIACAAPGDEIVVPAGSYPEKLYFVGKALTLRSSDPNDPAVVAATVLGGSGTEAAFVAGETNACVVDGITLSGGHEGVLCFGAAPTIRNCVIAGHGGAGVRMANQSKPLLTRCRIVGNGGNGVDMFSAGSSRSMTFNAPVLTNCIVAGNRLAGVRGSQPVIANSTIVENLKEGVNCTTTTMTNSIVFSNGGAEVVVSSRAAVSYSDIEGGMAGTGNINADPRFVTPGQWAATGWTEGDYHLKSQGWRWDVQGGVWTSDDVTSPCIDAGDPSASLLDEPTTIPGVPDDAVVNSRINIGAFGGTSQASVKRANP